MRIGEAAAKAGLEPTAIRFYEKHGVLPGPERTDSGYRDYTDTDVALLLFVRRARRRARDRRTADPRSGAMRRSPQRHDP